MDYLMHYGVRGMKWGVRKPTSLAGTGHRALAGIYGINQRFYSKNNRNNTLASMNANARKEELKKAAHADAVKKAKRQAKAGERAVKKMDLANKKLNSIADQYDKLEKKGYLPGDRKWDKLDAKYEKYSNAYWDNYFKSVYG